MEINCCGIALTAIIVNLISLLFFFGYSAKVKINDKSSVSFSKDTLPIVGDKLQTNYKLAEEDAKKISILEKKVEELENLLESYNNTK